MQTQARRGALISGWGMPLYRDTSQFLCDVGATQLGASLEGLKRDGREVWAVVSSESLAEGGANSMPLTRC